MTDDCFAHHELSRRRFLAGAVALGATWTLLPRASEAASPGGEWLAGDFHCHTIYSYDVSRHSLERVVNGYTKGFTPAEQIALASSRGLDFLAITDHETVSHLADPGYRATDLVLIPGYEHTLKHGHAGLLGVTKRYTTETGDVAGLLRLRNTVHRAGGLMIANHPRAANRKIRWRYADPARPSAVEVWNGGLHEQTNAAGRVWWERDLMRNGARRMAMVGGSDNHFRARAKEGRGVGQPTTWVLARRRDMRSIIEGVRAGRTSVSAQPPALGGARLSIHLERGGARWGIGRTAPSAPWYYLVARVLNAPGHTLTVVVGGARTRRFRVPDADARLVFRVSPDASVRVETARAGFLSALTSPVYVGKR